MHTQYFPRETVAGIYQSRTRDWEIPATFSFLPLRAFAASREKLFSSSGFDGFELKVTVPTGRPLCPGLASTISLKFCPSVRYTKSPCGFVPMGLRTTPSERAMPKKVMLGPVVPKVGVIVRVGVVVGVLVGACVPV